MVAVGDGQAEAGLDSGTRFGAIARRFAEDFRSGDAAGVQRIQRKVIAGGQTRGHTWRLGRLGPAGKLCTAALAIAGACGPGVADCFGESREPDAGPGECTREGNGDAHGRGRGTRQADPAIACRKLIARGDRRCARCIAGARFKPSAGGLDEHGTSSAVRGSAYGLARAWIYFRAGYLYMRALRACSSAASHQCLPRLGLEGRRPRSNAGPLAVRIAPHSGGFANRAVSDASGGSAALRSEPEESRDARSGVPARRHTRCRHRLYRPASSHRGTTGIFRRTSAAACAGSPAWTPPPPRRSCP